jgi:hypothetical protein
MGKPSRSETSDHSISRDEKNMLFGVADPASRTRIYDKNTGKMGEGLSYSGHEDADEQAWDDLRSQHEAGKR